MKRRILTISLVVAALVLLVTVGFAAWTINGSQSDTKAGNFEAYSVTNNGQLIVSNVTGNIKFGRPSTPAVGSIPNDAWFRFDNEVELQSLTATFTVQLDGKDSGVYALNCTTDLSDYSGLISGPTFEVTNGNAASIPTSGDNAGKLVFESEGTVTITVTFSWGNVFDNSNPYDFFYSKRLNKADLLASGDLTDVASTTLVSGGNPISAQNNITYAKLAELAMKKIYDLNSGNFTIVVGTPS